MNEFKVTEVKDSLESVFLNILHLNSEDRLINPNSGLLIEMKKLLNELFNEYECTNIIYTNNTDKPFFCINVDPEITGTDAIIILCNDDKFKLNKYQIEFDSKLFNLGLTAEELVSVLLYEISSIMDTNTINRVRGFIDLKLEDEDDYLDLRKAVEEYRFIIYGIKDAMFKLSSILFKEDYDEIAYNTTAQELSIIDSAISALKKIENSFLANGGYVKQPKVTVLQWVLMYYKEIKFNINVIKDTLIDAKDFTGSKLVIKEIDKILNALNYLWNQPVAESGNILRVLEDKISTSVLEASLFKSLKSNGLRTIEDSYYEYAMRIKNCETEEDAIYILRCINTRISILEDYIYNTEISEKERKRWEELVFKYRELREILSKKKIWKKSNYGLFIDYNELDSLDKDNQY